MRGEEPMRRPPQNLDGKYLRMRGEEIASRTASAISWEIPPHARRRVPACTLSECLLGNTSACAEKSPSRSSPLLRAWKYLRMRGEERRVASMIWAATEIPPHARRREYSGAVVRGTNGNTSACAEKSYGGCIKSARDRKYLRMRGEETPKPMPLTVSSEIPPHARRRARRHGRDNPLVGNTSACAEKSRPAKHSAYQGRKYLRMRGEELPRKSFALATMEIPPHARRRAVPSVYRSASFGNTSACAEKSLFGFLRSSSVGNTSACAEKSTL